ncbi:uncharacterized protein EDB91DRAFT_1164393 [Suillus paluster]|uniref:uncharacterized protein n=1 Tax=Suillus paluster TaxID=48578 RepID=UPI001B882731|nr:uncharacterized protein EDB91DRAFT_1164393 [Suillus paluster]KAG1727289.1 hypothetical protein EDB91DRAFT_1164393 [Suillus paluster]
MRFYFVLPVVAALTASISASPIDGRNDADTSNADTSDACRLYCNWDPCCREQKCILSGAVSTSGYVSTTSSRPGFNRDSPAC